MVTALPLMSFPAGPLRCLQVLWRVFEAAVYLVLRVFWEADAGRNPRRGCPVSPLV